MSLIILAITNPARTEFETVAFDTDQLDLADANLSPVERVSTHLHAYFRKATKTLSTAMVKAALKTQDSTATARWLMSVHGHYVVIIRGTQETVVFFKDSKPFLNQIKDPRTRPAPFNADGTCSG